ncbi:MAG: response regulator [Alphaproteobacteria bacterium]|nr:response regulator [Alphaproteobacteria bacterium]
MIITLDSQQRTTLRISMHCRVLWLLLCVIGGVFAQAALNCAQAQITPTARVELSDERDRIFFGPQIYITQDPDFRLNARILVTRHQNNLRGPRQDSELINFGAAPVPVWMVFSVTNNSSKEGWVLHFGDVFDGRLGQIRHILIGNESTGQTLIRQLPDGQPAYNAEGLKGAAFPLRIAKGQTQLFVVYVDMAGGLAHTIRPSLISYDRYIQNLITGTIAAESFTILILLLAGFFATLCFLQKNPEYLYLSLYFILCLLLYKMIDMVFLTDSITIDALLSLLYVAPVLTGLLQTRHFFGLSTKDEAPNALIFFAIISALSCLIFSQFLPGKFTSIDEYMIFLPALLGAGVCAIVSFTQSQHGKFGGLSLSVAWLVSFLAYTAMFTGSMGFAGPFTFGLFWVLLLPQGGLFIIACLHKIRLGEEQDLLLRARESRTVQSLARLKQSKETADQARLLRVIERERELMTELREREMRRTEDMRKAKEMADEANRAKSAFLAVVSHEIRTPMNGIMGMLRLLMDSKMTRQQNEYLQTIQNSGDTMMALLNDILDFEKIESGNMQLEHIDFDMVRLVRGIITLMSGHAAEKRIELRAQISDDFPRTLRGDPTRLRQILLNLLSNAIKFTAQGHVTIHLRSTLSEKGKSQGANTHEIYCAIEDTGIGIAEDSLKNLFTPFKQAEKSTARKYGGTGLGLAISRKLLENMGSAIQVRSEEGKGSTFFFTLWLEEGGENVTESSGEDDYKNYTDIDLPPMDILIIDDNALNRKVLEGFLSKGPHRLTSCASAEEALSICEDKYFDAVLTDIRLDGMDGMEFTRRLHANPNPEVASTPVIALTGNVSVEDQMLYKNAGMTGFLAKPVNPEALFMALTGLKEEKAKIFREKSAPTLMDESEEVIPVARAAPPESEFDKKISSLASAVAFADEDEDVSGEDVPTPESETDAGEGEGSPPQQGQVAPPIPEALDFQMLDGLASALPVEQLGELLQSLYDKADELVDALSNSANAHNAEFLHERAHELKGMAANFGLKEVSALAGMIEKSAKNSELARAQPAIEKLADAYRRAYTALQDWQISLKP